MGTIVARGSKILDKLSLIAVNEERLFSVLYPLLQVGESAYEEGPGKIFAIRSDIPADGLPAIVRLKAIHFAANLSFVGTLRLEFESHLDGLNSSLLQYFEENAHQPAVEGKYDGVRLVKSRGLAFIPCATAEIALEQGLWAPITEVISRVFAGLGLQDREYDLSLDWMQVSFTAQTDRTYTSHICTRQDPHQV